MDEASYSNCLDFVVVVAAWLRQLQQDRTNFGLHVGLRDEALLQQNEQRCLTRLPHLQRMNGLIVEST